MKKMFTTVLTAIVVLLAGSGILYAANDTLVVYASDAKTLDQVIAGDRNSDGSQVHNVYKLVSLDTTYIYHGAITVTSDFTVVGQLGSDGRPPCIQPGVLSDGSMPLDLFIMNGPGTKAVLKNLYLLGQSTSATHASTSAIKVTADDIKLTCDNVVFEEWWQYAIGYSGNMNSFFITNCKFRNLAQYSWYSGEVLRSMNGAAPTDSVVMKYNTFLCGNSDIACPITKAKLNYFEFDHNSIVWTFKEPFWIFNVVDAKINNNIFYGVSAGGQSQGEFTGWWDALWSLDTCSVIDLDTLDINKAKEFVPSDSASPNIRWIAEAKRKVELKNNVYFMPKEVTDYLKAWNDTAAVENKIVPNGWMNQRTKGMFADKEHWPGFVAENNQIGVDPGYATSIHDVLYENKNNGVGMLKYIEIIRTGITSSDYWGYLQTVVQPVADWVPAWPLPETAALKYSNTSLLTASTDGRPIGDPGWFNGGYTGVEEGVQAQVPSKFSLSEAYPNPFNPSTNVKFNLNKDGNVSLKIYNVMGELVRTIIDNEYRTAGEYISNINMNNLSSGVYFFTVSQGGQQLTKKMMLLK
jgi:hypothetical protein